MELDRNYFEEMEAKIPKGKVRTRFAPSPTGYMHVGNLRTALYTWLIAGTPAVPSFYVLRTPIRAAWWMEPPEVIYKTLAEWRAGS